MTTTDLLYKRYKQNFSTNRFRVRKRKRKLTDFNLIKELGSGYSGKIYLASLSSDSEFYLAIKIMEKNTQHADNELKYIKKLQSPYVVKLYDKFSDKDNLYFVLELGPHGDLYDKLYKETFIREADVKPIIRDICKGLKYCHDRNIVHGDIKKENVLVFDDCVKLIDFGLSFDNNFDGTIVGGTMNYIAPEIAHNLWHLCGNKVDIWALGVLTFELLTGYSPFVIDSDPANTIKNILLRKLNIPRHISTDARIFIEWLIQTTPSSRPTVDEILDSAWLSDNIV